MAPAAPSSNWWQRPVDWSRPRRVFRQCDRHYSVATPHSWWRRERQQRQEKGKETPSRDGAEDYFGAGLGSLVMGGRSVGVGRRTPPATEMLPDSSAVRRGREPVYSYVCR